MSSLLNCLLLERTPLRWRMWACSFLSALGCSAESASCQNARLAALPVARRFIRHDKGATAVEFSLIMLPFLTLLFMTMETGVVFLAQQSLETAAADAGRLVMTGQAQTLSADAFKTKVCAKNYAMFDCSKIYVDVKSYGSSFSSIDKTIQYDAGGNPKTQFSPGSTGNVAVVRLMYQWPIISPLAQPYLADSGSTKRLLVATATFRNEP